MSYNDIDQSVKTTAIVKFGGITINDAGADVDSRIEGDTDANLVYVDAGNDRVGIGTATPAEKHDVNGAQRLASYNDLAEISTPSTPSSGYGRLFVDTNGRLCYIDDAGNAQVVSANNPVFKAVTYNSQASGTDYELGYYDAPAADVTLTQASTTQTFGTANHPYAAHAFLVASGAGTASGGSGAVTITVSGTSITDSATRTAADTETIVADITTMSTDAYYETTKKWIGQITYTIDPGATGHTSYSATFNYGFAKYEDFSNSAFKVTDFQMVGTAGATDSSFEVELLHHSSTGWTYSAAAFDPGGTVICSMNTDHSTEQDLANGERFAYKRDDLTQAVDGTALEGVVVRLTTGVNNSVENAEVSVGVLYT